MLPQSRSFSPGREELLGKTFNVISTLSFLSRFLPVAWTNKNSAANQMAAVQQRRALTTPTFTKNWLSDPSTYPIMVVVGGAVSMMTVFCTYKFTYCPDVRVSSAAKGKTLRTWGGFMVGRKKIES